MDYPLPSALNPVHFHLLKSLTYQTHLGVPALWLTGQSACNVRDLGLIPASGRSPGVRKWQPTPVFLPGEFYGERSLAGYSSWGHKESDVTEPLTLTYTVSDVEGAVVNKQRRASPLGASPFEEESQHLFYFILFISIYFY